MMKRILGGVAMSALMSAAVPGIVQAQETTSSIRGEVQSYTGAPVANAQVVITHTPSGTRAVSRTNAEGLFDARGLRVGGPYRLEFSAPNFKPTTMDDVFLTLGETSRIFAEIEEQGTEITVTARRPTQADLADGSATSLTRGDIDSVVSIGRDVRDFARRDPLVSQDLGRRGGGGSGGISIAGSAPRANRISVDGMQAGDDFGLNTSGLSTIRGPISFEAIEQFTIEASPLDVENGDFSGGALNTVLRQGGNKFTGSAFVNYLNEGLVGTQIRGDNAKAIVTQELWGGFLSGPILKDRLFFALAYETFTSADITERGLDENFLNRINGLGGTGTLLTQSDVDGVLSAFNSGYAASSGFPTGSIPLTAPVTDDKYSARIDWNITDNHRANLTYRFAQSSQIIRAGSATSANLSSNWYAAAENEAVTVFQLNSDWTPNLSSELRISHRIYDRNQDPPGGQTRGQVSVCLDNTGAPGAVFAGTGTSVFQCNNNNNRPTLFWGPDQFRQANALDTKNTQAQFGVEYSLGRHVLKAGAQWQQIDILNLFVPQSDGLYYFDNVEGLRQGQLSRFQYRNALTGKAEDVAADFVYALNSIYLQDTWDVTDKLEVSYGLRYDWYSGDDKPALNSNFAARNGFANTKTYDGLDVLMPRVSFRYRPTDSMQFAGGVGLVSGGVPDVFLSNSFSNTGILDNSIDIQRSTTAAAGCIDGNNVGRTFTAAECATLLGVNRAGASTFTTVPSLAQSLVSAGGAPIASEVNALDRSFEIPSDWRANLSAKWDVRPWARLGLDIVGVRSNDGLAMRDGRAVPLIVNGQQLRTPDGRLRYDGLSATAAQRTALGGTALQSVSWFSQIAPATAATNIAIGNNRDIIAYNPGKESYSVTAALSVSGEFDNGIGYGLSYTRQKAEDFGTLPIFATTAGGIYGEQYTSIDPNGATFGRSNNEIEESFKADLTWKKKFVGELETRFTLFGESRSGTPINFLQGGGGNRNSTYGVNRGDHLLYVPNLANPRGGSVTGTIVTDDPRVVFADQATYNFVRDVVNRFGLSQGGIVEKGAATNPTVNRMDLQIAQELPGVYKNHKTTLTLDVQNLLNLMDDDWGVVEEFTDRRANGRIVDALCADATGVAAAASTTTCATYRYQNANTGFLTPTRNTDLSRWYIQVGLKYQF